MINTAFLRKLTLVIITLFFASCDKDYNTLGSDIIGDENFNFKGESFDVKAYNLKLPAVETNNLAVNQLGVLVNKNAIFGTRTSNFVTQLSLASSKPVVKANAVIDSVMLVVPYFSTKYATDANGRSDYYLNSTYTNSLTSGMYAPIDLKVFRNGFFLNDTELGTGNIQKHYSDEDAKFSSQIVGAQLNNFSLATENTAFVPNSKEYVKFKVGANLQLVSPKEVEFRSAPALRLHLDKAAFQADIIDAARNPVTAVNFVNDVSFKSYYRGLYFQVAESTPGYGTSMSLNFAAGQVIIYYKQDGDTGREMATFAMGMKGNTVNLLKNTNEPAAYTSAVNNATGYVSGVDKLYLKGGEGSMAFIELFPTVPGSTKMTLAQLKAKNVLVNEASLTFTVDRTAMSSDYIKPLRVYLYDADTNTPLLDYYYDNTINASDVLRNKYIHDGIIESNGTKDTYKVRITQHINSILKEVGSTSKNVRLGLVVSEGISIIGSGGIQVSPGNYQIPAPISFDLNKKVTKVPQASIINPLGTVLYGTNTGTPDNDIKFEIYYTEPK